MAAVTECMASETFADGVGLEDIEGAFFVGMVAGVGCAVGEDVVFVCFLGIGIWTNLFCVCVCVCVWIENIMVNKKQPEQECNC